MEGKDFAGKSTPTSAPADPEKPVPVGVTKRKAKALPEGRRQHRRPLTRKSLFLLA